MLTLGVIAVALLLAVPASQATECVVSEWSQWSHCFGDCTYGQELRNRDVAEPPLPEGLDTASPLVRLCPHLYETRFCTPLHCLPNGGQGITDTPAPDEDLVTKNIEDEKQSTLKQQLITFRAHGARTVSVDHAQQVTEALEALQSSDNGKSRTETPNREGGEEEEEEEGFNNSLFIDIHAQKPKEIHGGDATRVPTQATKPFNKATERTEEKTTSHETLVPINAATELVEAVRTELPETSPVVISETAASSLTTTGDDEMTTSIPKLPSSIITAPATELPSETTEQPSTDEKTVEVSTTEESSTAILNLSSTEASTASTPSEASTTTTERTTPKMNDEDAQRMSELKKHEQVMKALLEAIHSATQLPDIPKKILSTVAEIVREEQEATATSIEETTTVVPASTISPTEPENVTETERATYAATRIRLFDSSSTTTTAASIQTSAEPAESSTSSFQIVESSTPTAIESSDEPTTTPQVELSSQPPQDIELAVSPVSAEETQPPAPTIPTGPPRVEPSTQLPPEYADLEIVTPSTSIRTPSSRASLVPLADVSSSASAPSSPPPGSPPSLSPLWWSTTRLIPRRPIRTTYYYHYASTEAPKPPQPLPPAARRHADEITNSLYREPEVNHVVRRVQVRPAVEKTDCSENPRCCKVERRVCPDGSQPTPALRYYRPPGSPHCLAYHYPRCSGGLEAEEQPIQFAANCYDLCFALQDKNIPPLLKLE